MNKNVYSVTQVNNYIERMFQDDFMLGNLAVSGEVSNCKYNHTGHIYFTLKDEKNTISCVMFAGNRARGLSFTLKDGDKIVIHGYVGIYKVAGTYQIYAKKIELAGVGDLHAKFESLKRELEESGMFDSMYKKPIPKYVKRVGVVTAPTGAAIHDIIQVSKRRNPFVSIVLYPALVQGEGAKESIVNGIRCLDQMNLDVIIVGRGGGSIEDLWAFNEIEVAKAIFNCNTPIISAVGHEVDFTIADFVADKRAATPSQAAELANFIYEDFVRTLQQYSDRLNSELDRIFSIYDRQLDYFQKQLKHMQPINKINANEQRSGVYYDRLLQGINKQIDLKTNKFLVLLAKLESNSPGKRLSRGFGYITTSENQVVESVDDVNVDDTINIRLSDGLIVSKVDRIIKN